MLMHSEIVWKKLATNPSQHNFQIAQSELGKFRRKLPQYVAQHGQTYPLQVQSWQNRLLALENLLNYGQRTVLPGSTNDTNAVMNR